jgi:hypothetical protein
MLHRSTKELVLLGNMEVHDLRSRETFATMRTVVGIYSFVDVLDVLRPRRLLSKFFVALQTFMPNVSMQLLMLM